MAFPLSETTGAQEAGGRFKMRRGRGPIAKRSVQGNGIDDGSGASVINACRMIAKRWAVAVLVDRRRFRPLPIAGDYRGGFVERRAGHPFIAPDVIAPGLSRRLRSVTTPDN